jgi:hypothetical protein
MIHAKVSLPPLWSASGSCATRASWPAMSSPSSYGSRWCPFSAMTARCGHLRVSEIPPGSGRAV